MKGSRRLGRAESKGLIDRLFAVLDGLSNAAFAVALVQAIGAILLIITWSKWLPMRGAPGNPASCAWSVPAAVVHPAAVLVEAMLAATMGVGIAVTEAMVVRALFAKCAQPVYQANLIAKVDYGPILIITSSLRENCCCCWA